MVKNPLEKRYDRLAPFYDLLENPMEMMGGKKWRGRLFREIEGEKILEVGVGTGKNFLFYPAQKSITAIDISQKMLSRAFLKAAQLDLSVSLLRMDVQDLKFPDEAFDAVVATFVFCSVPDPEKGLREIKRVLKPGGKIFFLEHVRPPGKLGNLFDFFNPLFSRLIGVNINRNTAKNIKNAGLRILQEENLGGDIFKFMKVERD